MSLRLYARPLLQGHNSITLARQIPQGELLRTRRFVTIFGIKAQLGRYLVVGIISYLAGVASVFGVGKLYSY